MAKVVVDLIARTAGLNAGLGGVARSVLRVTAVVTAAGGAMAALTKRAINQADEMGKLAQSVGIAVDTLSRLSGAAEFGNVSLAKLQVGLGMLAKNLQDFSNGTGEARVAFQEMDIAALAANGNLRAVDEVLLEVADKFAAMPDSAEKTAFAMRLFGESGRQLIPFLNQGSEALREQMEEYERFGNVVGPKFAAQAATFNDNLRRLGNMFQGLWRQLARQLLPTLIDWSEGLIQAIKTTGAWEGALQTLVDIVKIFIIGADVLLQILRGLDILIATGIQIGWAVWNALLQDSIQLTGILVDSLDALSRGFRNVAEQAARSGRVMQAALKGDFDSAALLVAQMVGKTGAGFEEMVARTRENTLKALALVSDGTVRAFGEVVVIGRGALQDLGNQWDKFWQRTVNRVVDFGRLAPPAGDDGEPEAKVRSELEVATEINTIRERLAAQDKARTDKMVADRERAAASISGIFQNSAAAAEAFGEKGFAAYKALASAAALVDTYRAATAAYAAVVGVPYVGPILAPIAAGAAVAAGLANIALINAASFMTGGVIPGGEQMIRVNEQGTEGVVNARGMRNLGADGLAAINAGLTNAANLATSIPARLAGGIPAGGGGAGTPSPAGGGSSTIHVLLVDSRNSQAARQFLESSAGRAIVRDVVTDQRQEIGVPT